MKKLLLLLLLAWVLTPLAAETKPADLPAEYVVKNPDGSVMVRNVYTRDDKGVIVKSAVYDAKGTLLHTEIPYYNKDGKIIRRDDFSPDGKPTAVVVFLEDKLVVLSPSGETIKVKPFSQDDKPKPASTK